MNRLKLKLHDGDVVFGYSERDAFEGTVTFVHEQGGRASIPVADCKSIEVVARDVKIKTIAPVDSERTNTDNATRQPKRPKSGSNTEKVLKLAETYKGDLKSKEFRAFVMEELGITEANARYAISKL